MKKQLIGAAAVGVSAFAPAIAQAAPFEVTDLNDGPAAPCMPGNCSLRDAVTDAAGTAERDQITFQSGLSGTLRLTQGELSLADTAGVDISGPGAGLITISGDADNSGTFNAGDSRILSLSGAAGQTTVSGLTLTGGYAAANGGAVTATGGQSLTLDRMVVQGNKTLARGGGIATLATATVTNSTISGNEGVTGGGGFYAAKALTLESSKVSGNTSAAIGGGIMSAPATIKYSPDLTVRSSDISGNSGSVGGGLYHGSDSGFVPTPGAVLIDRSTFDDNHATAGDGGGVAVGSLDDDDAWSITHSTFSGGTATGIGGGIAVNRVVDGSFELVDSTVSGNSADRGGGVSFPLGDPAVNASSGSLEIESSTVAGNSATTQGGGFYLGNYTIPNHDSSTIPLSSTVVANNTAPAGPDLGMADDAASGGFALAFSLVEDPAGAKLPGSTSSRTGVDPQLGGLGNNGGPTETMLPAASSPLVDKGKAPSGLTTDQRGESRTNGRPPANAADGTDIGAVELPSQPFETTITQSPKAKVKSKKSKVKVTIAFASDAEGAQFQCAVDGTSFSSCASPLTLTLKAKKKKGKRHTILVRAVADGAVDASPAQVTFKAVQKSKKKKKKKKRH